MGAQSRQHWRAEDGAAGGKKDLISK